MTETQLKNKVKEYLDTLPVAYRKIAGGPRQRAGISDFLIFLPPRAHLLALELKAPGKLDELTDPQRRFLEEMAKVGAYCVIADDLHSAKAAIDMFLQTERRDDRVGGLTSSGKLYLPGRQ